MEYTGRFREMNSIICGEKVCVLEYKMENKHDIPYMHCDRCGKPIFRKMFVVQSCETDVELMYLGSECIKSFN